MRHPRRLAAALLLLGAVLGRACAQDSYAEISYPDLVAAIKHHQVALIDCDLDDLYLKMHIPGAISYGRQHEQLAALLPADKNTLVVSYCTSPQ
jgi:rhodanese-related sulfurtransferase